jgi:FtsP/CotA-like multicopper oxidase with cupredoxin domain
MVSGSTPLGGAIRPVAVWSQVASTQATAWRETVASERDIARAMRSRSVLPARFGAWTFVVLLTRVSAAAVPFSNPAEIASSDGVLATTLTIEPAQLKVAGKKVTFPALYDGQYTPPLLRVQPGDRMEVTVRNFVQTRTNIHYHGLDVTPAGHGDNVYVVIDEGGSFQNLFTIPTTQSAGLFWYHPHLDPELNTQLGGGMAGGIIIGDILAPFPELADIPERVLLLKDLKTRKGEPEFFPAPAGRTRRTINGLWKPRIEMNPGQLEFWRFGNQSSNIYYDLRFDGQPFYVIAIDGNLQNQAVETKALVIPPGSRYEVLVYGPKKRGTYRLRA